MNALLGYFKDKGVDIEISEGEDTVVVKASRLNKDNIKEEFITTGYSPVVALTKMRTKLINSK